MKRNDQDKSSDADESGQPDESFERLSNRIAVREDDLKHRENALMLEKSDLLIREKELSSRLEYANSRENRADIREDKANSREREILAIEMSHSASEDHFELMQQANANLVIATIESHKMAEQVQIAKDQLAHMAYHDVLTNLPNRILLLDRLRSAIELAARQGWQLGLMFLDLDHFKHINDSLGHGVGDQLLESVAQRLVSCARHSDTISRQGGDEFVVLLPFIEHAGDAALCAQKIISALDLPHHIGSHVLHISVSIGISIYPDDGRDAETLIKNADTAMYCAKENGRNKFKFFEADMNIRAVQRHSIEIDLRHALERQEFMLYFQPKIDLNSGLMVGVEALVRWQHPEQGLVLPSLFVPIAEECGLILAIDRWVLREACRQAQAWLQAGLPPITIAVNTSAIDFHDENFLDTIRLTLKETGLDPSSLELELTESVLMRDAEFTNALLEALSDLGVKLAIDDFGTGYSSLSYLRQFPIDKLKIDQSFVNKMIHNPDDASIVSAIISLGKTLKLHVIAEGVETPEQLKFLQSQDCDEVQGYFLGRPMRPEALASQLEKCVSPVFNA
jgi:diguanylate cyclase (GGDEF)-like protein